MKAIATKVYHASEITADSKVRARTSCRMQATGYPVCVAKTQYSFDRPEAPRCSTGHVVNIREVRLPPVPSSSS